jgi:hypothetical protein
MNCLRCCCRLVSPDLMLVNSLRMRSAIISFKYKHDGVIIECNFDKIRGSFLCEG